MLNWISGKNGLWGLKVFKSVHSSHKMHSRFQKQRPTEIKLNASWVFTKRRFYKVFHRPFGNILYPICVSQSGEPRPSFVSKLLNHLRMPL